MSLSILHHLAVKAYVLCAFGFPTESTKIREITGVKILGLFTDIDVQLGERVFVFTMDGELQNGKEIADR
ncbi:MAG: DUF2294 family protein [Nitrospira sp. CG24B]|nr:MAG: DUF2294 family protein [Nitrospira sp. CG24B]